ncbi:chemotaxis protein CheX [Botrimarina mediterranea]|uniref:CheY-P phosphatase CheX n=1 Tax=Botrimarina mediterranea TaxID=2528022 RepID=A0A518K6M7_9BACT|nr:chemotaxis protein CheX [Botrimarina mediterranea]QDV73453.1 CheY-P phosphatase CheX [Botrimarina mediterranea]QDV77970.1 CheY-P phosphatase CheX [Planctomycetes bacterium K2D]
MSATFVQPTSDVMVAVINPLLGSVVETFNTMLGSKARRGALELRGIDAEPYEISALIALSGGTKGVICLSFDRLTALEIGARLLGGSNWKLTPAVLDAVGEIANVVAGSAKSKLEMGLNMGLPAIVRRENFCIRFPSGSDPMRLHFDSDIGPFFVDFGFVVSGL